MTDKRIGLVFGGGGEVGIAWEIGVVAALERSTRFRASECTVVAGTSAGAVVGAYVALEQDFAALAARDAAGEGATSPVPIHPTQAPQSGSSDAPPAGTSVVPADLMALLMSSEGSIKERAAAIGQLAATKTTAIHQDQFVDAFAAMLGTREWPSVEFRPSAVVAETGETHLWRSGEGADLATAVASSCAVPGFFPVVRVGDGVYLDGPRTPFTAELVEEYRLDAVIFIGLDLPILSNSEENASLRRLADSGVTVVSITGGPRVSEVAVELMDPGARPQAVAIGEEDGLEAAQEVAERIVEAAAS